ncbi:unnamed protein product [Paramecium pentaurelia]|uniref:C3H1-type domain-containing protein n=1 Tax=Paramecium pentaurelia TaxID=43138 RepID=A0A8S1UCB8_9CILI|nr:unnamed protein product [Paramecium pentaurelia]
MISLTPLKKYYNYGIDYQNASTDEDEEQFQIDVQPKKKYFETIEEKIQYIEEYTKKKKTELCKNFQLTGQCKFGNECSFAHGFSELQAKTHLHQKYKTKPCNRYFNQGFCPYGIRCQYLHDEIKDQSRFEKFLQESYQNQGMKPSIARKYLNNSERLDIQRFQQVLQKFVKKGFNVELNTRSKFFVQLENNTKLTSQF